MYVCMHMCVYVCWYSGKKSALSFYLTGHKSVWETFQWINHKDWVVESRKSDDQVVKCRRKNQKEKKKKKPKIDKEMEGGKISNKNINKDEKRTFNFSMRYANLNELKGDIIQEEDKRKMEQKRKKSWIHANIPRWMLFLNFQVVNQSLNKWVHCTALGLLFLFFSGFCYVSAVDERVALVAHSSTHI